MTIFLFQQLSQRGKKAIHPPPPRRSLKYLPIEVSCPMAQARVVTIKWCRFPLMSNEFAFTIFS